MPQNVVGGRDETERGKGKPEAPQAPKRAYCGAPTGQPEPGGAITASSQFPWNACSLLENAAFLGGATHLAGASLLEVTSGVRASQGQAGCVCIPRCAGAVGLETDGGIRQHTLSASWFRMPHRHAGADDRGAGRTGLERWAYAMLVLAAYRA